jgi:hypothetical protein
LLCSGMGWGLLAARCSTLPATVAGAATTAAAPGTRSGTLCPDLDFSGPDLVLLRW